MGKLRPVPGRRVEELDGEFVVLDAELGVVHRLTGASADIYRRVREDSGLEDIGSATHPVVAGLIDLGLVEVEAEGMSRRHVLQSGLTLAAVGVFTLSLPHAAHASSHIEVGLLEINSAAISSPQGNGYNDISGTYDYPEGPTGSRVLLEHVTVRNYDDPAQDTVQRVLADRLADSASSNVSYGVSVTGQRFTTSHYARLRMTASDSATTLAEFGYAYLRMHV